jgi:hypothetical protein
LRWKKEVEGVAYLKLGEVVAALNLGEQHCSLVL